MRFFTALFIIPFLLCSCVFSNFGTQLDSKGKAVPTVRHRFNEQHIYQLNNAYYMECDLVYLTYTKSSIDVVTDHVNTCGGTYEAPDANTNAPAPEKILIRLDEKNPQLIKAKDFAYSKARRLSAASVLMKGLNFEVPRKLQKRFNPLTADIAWNTDALNIVRIKDRPEIRTKGNLWRRPLVAIVSYGVDVPLTVVGSTAMTGAMVIITPISWLWDYVTRF